jgi:hypothetical protein
MPMAETTVCCARMEHAQANFNLEYMNSVSLPVGLDVNGENNGDAEGIRKEHTHRLILIIWNLFCSYNNGFSM